MKIEQSSDSVGSVSTDSSETGYSTFEKKEEFYTLEDAIEQCGHGRFQCFILSFVGTAWLANSMQVMLLSTIGPTLICDFRITSLAVALLTSLAFTGVVIGAPVFGTFSDIFSRKTSLFFSSLWALYFSVLSSFSPTYDWLVILRFITGFGLGGIPQALTYYSEFLPGDMRGKCIILLAVFWAIGGILEVVLAMFIIPLAGWGPWTAVTSIPLLIVVVMCYWMPSSPRFDLTRGRSDLAEKTLQQMANMNNTDLPDGTLKPEVSLDERGRVKDLFTPNLRVTTLLLWFIWFGASFGDYGLVLMSTEIINFKIQCITQDGKLFENGVPPCEFLCKELLFEDYLALIVTSAAELPGLLFVGLLVDPLGRKKTMILTFFLYSITLLLLYICVNRSYIILMLFLGRAFGSSAFQVLNLYTPEVYNTQCRSVGVGMATAFQRIGNMFSPFVSVALVAVSLPAGIGIHVVMGLLVMVASIFLPYETSGKDMGHPSSRSDSGS